MLEKYDNLIIEKECLEKWEKDGVYKFDSSKPREEVFAIDSPPPTVSGSLHIGHIYGYTQADILARFHRMQGKNLFFPMGWDDNGLPTERRVQNYFNIKCDPTLPYVPGFQAEHKDKFDCPQIPVSRKNFTEHCWQLIAQDEKVFENIFKQMGFSYDWSLMYTTISPDAIRLAQESFIKMYRAGHVKSIDAPTMWDTDFQTAVSQAEVEDREIPGFFHDIKFQCDDDSFVIATTRPEFLPACIAIVAHPDDGRYKKFFGCDATVPLFGAKVPVMASKHADPEKGTGIMMVCTFGDNEDVKFWKEHNLPLKQIVGRDGRIMDSEFITKKEIVGMPIKVARKQIVEWLRESGDLVNDPRPITHAVKFYEKGDMPIEFVPSRQWFVSILDKKEMMIDAANKIKWTPEHMRARFINWAEGLNQNWAISRQRFFGVPFPVWYKLDVAGEPIFEDPIIANNLPCDPAVDVPDGFTEDMRGKPNGFIEDPDVMDTWATSSLTPKIAMARANNGILDVPFDTRWSGHDIIRTWDFYTVLVTMLNNDGKLPWKELWINGFVLDPDRKKMSKSKGNVVVPQDLVDKYGSEAIRLWAASSKWGTDGTADERVMDQKKKLVTKFFNAVKFIFGIIGDRKKLSPQLPQNLNPLDRSFISGLSKVCFAAEKSLFENDFTNALGTIEQAFWDFCDNYLEIAKGRAYAKDESAVKTLMLAFEAFTALFAPFMPFITEHVWGEWHNESIHSNSFPTKWHVISAFKPSDDTYSIVSELLKVVRGKKTEANKSMKAVIKKIRIQDNEFLRAAEIDIKNVLNVETIEFTGTELMGELVWGE